MSGLGTIYLMSMAEKYELVFENKRLKRLWEEHLIGQISDGYWENTPHSGWQFWCKVECKVGNKNALINKEYGRYSKVDCKNNFGFNRLIQYVGDEMINDIRKIEPDYDIKQLRKDLKTISNTIKGVA